MASWGSMAKYDIIYEGICGKNPGFSSLSMKNIKSIWLQPTSWNIFSYFPPLLTLQFESYLFSLGDLGNPRIYSITREGLQQESMSTTLGFKVPRTTSRLDKDSLSLTRFCWWDITLKDWIKCHESTIEGHKA